MKARRFFAFVAGAAMLFGVGCTPDGGKTEGDEAMAEIAVNPSSFATTLEGGEQVIAVTSNGTWTVSCDQADVTVEPLTGVGNGSVTITVPAAAAREFKVVFDAQKQTLIPALGTTTTTNAKAEVVVSQNAGGVNQSNFIYYEDCGEDVEKNAEGYWPYVDAYEGWNPQGDAAANVTYKGQSASVRAANSQHYGPTAEAVGASDKPYAFLNKVPSSAHFVIENIAVTGGSNYIFTYNVSCQNAYNGGTPGFATVDGSLVHLELGYDGVNWDAVECTFAPNGGNGWYAVKTEFKVAADATKLYARFTYEQGGGDTSKTGCRLDDFKLIAGGNGAELEVSAPQAPETQDGTIASITTTGNFSVKNAWVIATYAQGFLMTDSSNAVLLVYQGTGANIPAVGQVVNVSGTVSTYGGFLQFAKDGLTVEATGETKTVTNPTPETMSGAALDAWLKTPSIKFVEYVGQLTISGNYYNVTIPGASTAIGSVQYPTDAIKSALNGLGGKYIKVTGWLIGYSQSKYTNTMAVDVVETTAPEGGETPEVPEVPETPTTPIEGTYTKIDRAANVSAGTYLMAGYSESYTNKGTTTTFSPYPWHFWTGGQTTTTDKMYLYTVNYSYVDGALTLNPNLSSQDAEKGTAVEIELVAVENKANTYCIKYNGKYLNCTGKHTIALVDNAVEWTFEDHPKGGIKITDNTASGGVILGTAGATYNMLRCYASPANTLVYGVAFFKKN